MRNVLELHDLPMLYFEVVLGFKSCDVTTPEVPRDVKLSSFWRHEQWRNIAV